MGKRLRPRGVLSEQQLKVTVLLAEGLTTEEIAKRLFISTRTVRAHIGGALREVGARNRCHLVAVVHRTGQLPPSPLSGVDRG